MGKSTIEWTGKTLNPLVGCTMVSPGCAHCYAQTMAVRLKAMALALIALGRNPGRLRHYIEAIDENGRWSGRLIPVPEALCDPFKWIMSTMVFVNSMSDLFHDLVPGGYSPR
jgi:protein gp37